MKNKSKYQTIILGKNHTGKTAFAEEMIKQAKKRGLSVFVFKASEKPNPSQTQNIPACMLIRPIPQFKGLHMAEISPFLTEKTSKKWPKFPYIEIHSKKATNTPWHEDW